jgi:hypothetical protein
MVQGIQSVLSHSCIQFLISCQDSDIIYLNLLGTSVIVLSSLNATETLLQKRTFSDR